jgi:hypothetical protein
VKLKGAAPTEPSNAVPSKKETLVTVPELTVASAEIATSAGAVKIAPFAGLVMLTVGDGGVTVAAVERTYATVPELNLPQVVNVIER